MGKESEVEGTKKRRKSISSISSNTNMPVINKDNDMYKTIITFEEEEAIARLPTQDSEMFLSTCEDIRSSMIKIANLKVSKDPNAKDDIRDLQVYTALKFIQLKKLNRMEKFRTKFARDSLTVAKSRVDSRHLHLQNLLYEVMHLKKEVIKCLQFKSKDELIELVTEQEFYKNAPESVTRVETTQNDPHQLRLARLEWELTQRKQLSSLCDELSEGKKCIAQNIEQKQSRLDSLTPQLRSILEASKPLQDSLGLPLDKIHKEHQKAALLASPLYVVYTKATAYRDAYDSTLSVSVEGDEEEAKRINNETGMQDTDSEPDTQESVPEDIPVHKKRHHRLSREARDEEKRLRLLQKSPLRVEIILTIKNNTKLVLIFKYLIVLKVVTVESHLDTDEIGQSTADEMLVSDLILRELFPKDNGIESPNPANNYQLARYNLGSFSSLGLGVPYRWAQTMCGLHFIPPAVSADQNVSCKKLIQNDIENVLKEIKRRIKARIDLCNEIRLLESGNTPTFSGNIDPIPQKIITNITSFTKISWDNYCKNNGTAQDMYKNGLVSCDDIFYQAVLRRGTNELVVHITIKADYPKVLPIFTVVTFYPNPTSMDVIRDIERETNVMWERSPTLTAQLQRLRACFDIYLETENILPREKIFFHLVKGRTRARPYKYLTIGGGIFTHR
ncbi:hypothetical protein PV327_010502 [Microctonus hyperodae]|uniref:THO complex subunit 5 n=1 Tax=Microctonus hyperodae TaxID=165561 RepID=A0AA39FS22_MICHY|nr:hypothetical protein PV327_010502 [Microctonus hyperodae]